MGETWFASLTSNVGLHMSLDLAALREASLPLSHAAAALPLAQVAIIALGHGLDMQCIDVVEQVIIRGENLATYSTMTFTPLALVLLGLRGYRDICFWCFGCCTGGRLGQCSKGSRTRFRA